MKLQKIILGICLIAFTSINAQETNAPVFGKGLFNLVGKDSTYAMKVNLRAQLLASTLWEDGESPTSNFLVRRARLKFAGFAFSPKLRYKIELGLSNRDISGASPYTSDAPGIILDAVMKYNFAKNLDLWFGQTKLPGNRERVISSANLQQVDRSLLNATFNIDRDIGFQLRHHFNLTNKFVVREILSVAKGEGRNVTAANIGGFQYTGRVELLPFGNFTSNGDYSGSDLKREPKPKLALAASYDYNVGASKNRSNMGKFMENDIGTYQTDISAVFVDAMFKYNGFSFMTEYAMRDAVDPIAKNSDGTETGDVVLVGNGLNFQSGYLFKKNWEISGRYSNIKLDKYITGKEPENQYTLGLSKYIVGHKLKVQTDFSFLDLDIAEDIIMWRLQFEIQF